MKKLKSAVLLLSINLIMLVSAFASTSSVGQNSGTLIVGGSVTAASCAVLVSDVVFPDVTALSLYNIGVTGGYRIETKGFDLINCPTGNVNITVLGSGFFGDGWKATFSSQGDRIPMSYKIQLAGKDINLNNGNIQLPVSSGVNFNIPMVFILQPRDGWSSGYLTARYNATINYTVSYI